jgi:hypothetical protein
MKNIWKMEIMTNFQGDLGRMKEIVHEPWCPKWMKENNKKIVERPIKKDE